MNAADLRRLVFDFRAARAVLAGVELGLFEALGRERATTETLGAACAVPEHALGVLLDALTALGVLERKDGLHALTPGARKALLPDGDDYIGNLLQHDLWHWSSWAHLTGSLRSGRAHVDRSSDPHLADPEVLARFLPNYNQAMEQSARDFVPRLADRVAAGGPRLVVDLGGGSGDLLLAVLERVPEARGILCEHGFAIARARDRRSRHPSGRRLELRECDIERDPLPQGAAACVLSRVLMGLPTDRAADLVTRAARTLAPGGRLHIHDFDPSSRTGALLSLDMLLNTGAHVHAPGDVATWLEKAGLRVEERAGPVAWTRHITGIRPR